MKAYLPFGDWSQDGHKQYENVLVEIDDMKDLLEAQKKIMKIYGSGFFKNYANNYEIPKISLKGWQALIDNNMPLEIVKNNSKALHWDKFKTVKHIFNLYYPDEPSLDIGFIEQSFIWLLNQYGANIKICDSSDEIPQINNWTCPGFQTVGYGCFD